QGALPVSPPGRGDRERKDRAGPAARRLRLTRPGLSVRVPRPPTKELDPMRFKYVLSEVMVGLWRNVTMTIAMIITMGVSLTLLGASLLLYQQVERMQALYIQDVEVTMFLRVGDTPETQTVTDAQKQAIEAAAQQDQTRPNPIRA